MPLSEANDTLSTPDTITYWPWTQQEEWDFSNLKVYLRCESSNR